MYLSYPSPTFILFFLSPPTSYPNLLPQSHTFGTASIFDTSLPSSTCSCSLSLSLSLSLVPFLFLLLSSLSFVQQYRRCYLFRANSIMTSRRTENGPNETGFLETFIYTRLWEPVKHLLRTFFMSFFPSSYSALLFPSLLGPPLFSSIRPHFLLIFIFLHFSWSSSSSFTSHGQKSGN
jgi:hypothetical protein